MPASYPSSIKTFVNRNTGDVIQAAHVNDLQDEVNAIETDLTNGFRLAIRPDSSGNNRDIGLTTARFRDLFLKQTIDIDQGTITADTQAWKSIATWNAGAVTFVHKDTNITDTASAAASILERWRVGGAVKASISKGGTLTLAGNIYIAAGAAGQVRTTDANDLTLGRSSTTKITIGASEVTFVDPIRAALGSAALPSFTFSGDNTTGMYRFGAGAIGFATSGGARMNLDSTNLNFDSAVVARMSSQNRFRHLNSMVRARHSANQSISDATATALNFDTDVFDTDTLHDTVTNNTRLTAALTGKYLVYGAARWQANATGYRQIAIRVNGVTTVAQNRIPAIAGGIETIHEVVVLASLAATDYVEFMVFQNSGGALNSETSDPLPHFGMVYLGE